MEYQRETSTAGRAERSQNGSRTTLRRSRETILVHKRFCGVLLKLAMNISRRKTSKHQRSDLSPVCMSTQQTHVGRKENVQTTGKMEQMKNRSGRRRGGGVPVRVREPQVGSGCLRSGDAFV